MKRQIIFSAIACIALSLTAFPVVAGASGQQVGLTIYNQDFAVVRQSSQIEFEQGTNKVKFIDVASGIDPTSTTLRCLSAPGMISILEQNFEYDLAGTDTLLRRYIDKNVTIELKGSGADTGRTLTGILLAASGNDLTLKDNAGNIEIINRSGVESISLKDLPEGLVTKPTLFWLADAKQKGSQLCQLTYITERIGWKADYTVILNDDETKMDFTGWVTIDNKSGATYRDADLKLIAGDVRGITGPKPIHRRKVMALAEDARAGFEESPFMEYHLYTLGRKSTIANNEVKQIEFVSPVLEVPAKKLYIYERSKNTEKVQIKLEFENTTGNKLGIALPAGKIRVFKKNDRDNCLEFVGQDTIDHTPVKEKLSLYIGNAFDIVPEYTLLESRTERRSRRFKHKIELRNRKNQAVTVFVDEKFPRWVNWKIDEPTHKFTERDAHTARFAVLLKADSVTILQYVTGETW